MKKKKVAARKVVKKAHKTTRRVSAKKSLFNIRYLSFGVVGLLLFGLTVVVPHKGTVNQAVAGVSITRPLFMQGDVSWSGVSGARAYNIYYRKAGEHVFTNAVRGLSSQSTSYTISYLSRGVSYEYQVTALNASGREIWYSDVLHLTNLQSM